MLSFLQSNWGTLAALAAVAVLVFFAVRRMVLDKKAGIGACGQKCSKCAMAGHCETQDPPAQPQVKEKPASPCAPSACGQCPHRGECGKF